MKIHHVAIQNYAGVASAKVEFQDFGVTVISGVNEAGKSSILSAIRLILSGELHTSTKRDIRALQPVGKQVPVEVEMEFTVDGNRINVVKHFLVGAKSELKFISPVAPALTGREADDRLKSTLNALGPEEFIPILFLDEKSDISNPLNTKVAASLQSALKELSSESDATDNDLYKKAEARYLERWTATGRQTVERTRNISDLNAMRASVSALQAIQEKVLNLEETRAKYSNYKDIASAYDEWQRISNKIRKFKETISVVEQTDALVDELRKSLVENGVSTEVFEEISRAYALHNRLANTASVQITSIADSQILISDELRDSLPDQKFTEYVFDNLKIEFPGVAKLEISVGDAKEALTPDEITSAESYQILMDKYGVSDYSELNSRHSQFMQMNSEINLHTNRIDMELSGKDLEYWRGELATEITNLDQIESQYPDLLSTAFPAELLGKDLTQELANISAELNTSECKDISSRLEIKQQELADLEEKVESAESAANTATKLFETLKICKTHRAQALREVLEARINVIGSQLYGPQFEIQLTEGLALSSRTLESTVEVESLSRGAKEQLLLIRALACAEILGSAQSMPIFLDDALAVTDPGRLDEIFKILRSDLVDGQIILATCEPEKYLSRGLHSGELQML